MPPRARPRGASAPRGSQRAALFEPSWLVVTSQKVSVHSFYDKRLGGGDANRIDSSSATRRCMLTRRWTGSPSFSFAAQQPVCGGCAEVEAQHTDSDCPCVHPWSGGTASSASSKYTVLYNSFSSDNTSACSTLDSESDVKNINSELHERERERERARGEGVCVCVCVCVSVRCTCV